MSPVSARPGPALPQLFGKDGGFTRGRDRTFHFGVLEKHLVGMISHLGAMLPVADGLALASQLSGTRRVAAAFIGDGATSEGDFHEALNLAAVWKLPVLFVIENNQYGLSTPVEEQYACIGPGGPRPGYGMPGAVWTATTPGGVRAVEEAAARARRGGGPTLLEFKTFRMRGTRKPRAPPMPKRLFRMGAERAPWCASSSAPRRGVLSAAERDARVRS